MFSNRGFSRGVVVLGVVCACTTAGSGQRSDEDGGESRRKWSGAEAMAAEGWAGGRHEMDRLQCPWTNR